MSHFDKQYEYFNDREGRAAFIAHVFKKEITHSQKILDVGCDYNTLKKIVGEKVTGVDLYGEPDIRVDFEKEKLSRFQDGQFDLVVCTEVLEHLENLHTMIDELIRVSRSSVLISLPNCMPLFTRFNVLTRGYVNKFYGLPLEKPGDRHRWFFSHLDIDRFFSAYTEKHSLRITKKFLHCNFSHTWKGNLVRALVKFFDLDVAAQSYWILLEVKPRL